MPRVPVVRTTIEAVNVRKEGGQRVTRGVIDDYTHRLTEAEVSVRKDMGLVADDIHVDTDYAYEITTSARHARRRTA